MNDPDQFEKLVRDKLAAVEAQRRERKAKFVAEMTAREQRIERFDAFARRLITGIIVPRMERLTRCFDNARLEPSDPTRPRRAACAFDHTAMFPASTKVEFSVSTDEAVTKGLLVHSLEILPVLFEFDKGDQTSFAVEKPDEEPLAAWVDAKLLGFVDIYFRLTEADVYQQDNLVVDPVCGARINKLLAGAREELNGQTYFFCMDACRQKFLGNTARYLQGKVA
ncbi:MAG TPA: YHS domain-containing protein [Pirellulales bacterium]|nr:YHS domain-containing protein [Pirellulales bacterium]